MQETSAVDYLFMEKDNIAKAAEELDILGRQQVLGIMKVHSLVALDDAVYTRESSCYFPCCWSKGPFHPTCHGWMRQVEKEKVPIQTEMVEDLAQ